LRCCGALRWALVVTSPTRHASRVTRARPRLRAAQASSLFLKDWKGVNALLMRGTGDAQASNARARCALAALVRCWVWGGSRVTFL
jgi:hypothetical protein